MDNYILRTIQSNILLGIILALIAFKIVLILVSFNISGTVFFADITKSALLDYVNQTRQTAGLTPLTENEKLARAASLKAENMIYENYFSHTSPSGVTPWYWFSFAGYRYKYAGENLAVGFFDSKEVFDAWLNSQSHKENILNPNYTEVGTAVVSGFGPGKAVVAVQEFGSPLPEKFIAANPDPIKVQAEASQTAPAALAEEEPQVVAMSSERPFDFFQLFDRIIYGFSALVVIALLVVISLNSDIFVKKGFAFRAILIIMLLSVAVLLDKHLLISLIPHQVII